MIFLCINTFVLLLFQFLTSPVSQTHTKAHTLSRYSHLPIDRSILTFKREHFESEITWHGYYIVVENNYY